LEIISAKYGAKTIYVDVTDRVRGSINNDYLSIPVGAYYLCNNVYPYNGERKYAIVRYRNPNGTYEVSTIEGDQLILDNSSGVGRVF
jgi:hypothetical protein